MPDGGNVPCDAGVQVSGGREDPAEDRGVFEPSSKTCSVCGYKNQNLTLKDRAWTCPDCGTTHDRDLNAAINIKHFALARRRISAIEPVDPLPMGGRGGMKQEAPCVSGGGSSQPQSSAHTREDCL